MNTENVVHLYKGVPLSYINSELMKFFGKWMELETIILSEVTQSQNNTLDMQLLISAYKSKSLEYARYNSQTT